MGKGPSYFLMKIHFYARKLQFLAAGVARAALEKTFCGIRTWPLGKSSFRIGSLGFLRILWGSLGLLGIYGAPWGSLGFLGAPWSSFGVPFVFLGAPWGSWGPWES